MRTRVLAPLALSPVVGLWIEVCEAHPPLADLALRYQVPRFEHHSQRPRTLRIQPMIRMRTLSLVLLGLLIAPITAWAQSSLTGVVRDPSGAVLPRVTVEA